MLCVETIMRNKNLVLGISAILFFIVFIIVIISYSYFQKGTNDEGNFQIIGGDKDSQGCLVGAGYSWCESKQKCLRIWEESCAESFCLRENVAKVSQCGEYVKVTSSLLGGGNSYYTDDMIEIKCLVVAPEYISEECKTLDLLSCSEIKCY